MIHQSLVLVGATLIDGTGRAVVPNSGIRVEDERITAVGARPDFGAEPPGRVVDVTGCWVLPGLINMHAHVTFGYATGPPQVQMAKSAPELTIHAVRLASMMLAQGITTARDMGGTNDVPLRLRDAIAADEIPGPDVLACGQPISITGGHAWNICTEADGADGFRIAARRQMKAGADFVKVMASNDPWPMRGTEQTRAEVTLDEIASAFDVAHEWGRLACCHVMGSKAIGRVLEAGADIIEHGQYLTGVQAREMARKGVYYTPTLSSYDSQTMHPRFKRGPAWARAHEKLVPAHKDAMEAALDAGVQLVVGTDSVGCYAQEVDLLRRAGQGAMDSLRSCTSIPSAALRLGDEIGTVAVGHRADLLVIGADPIADPYALEEVKTVIKRGRLYEPAVLAKGNSELLELACADPDTKGRSGEEFEQVESSSPLKDVESTPI